MIYRVMAETRNEAFEPEGAVGVARQQGNAARFGVSGLRQPVPAARALASAAAGRVAESDASRAKAVAMLEASIARLSGDKKSLVSRSEPVRRAGPFHD